ncbi:antibiotic biosynthesis monooxygenase [Mesorhizobium sp. KR9-304]|uniref:antibiotic biosynthesis monooxygenase n=1 Tax=Mesorhizobium sp. KR9-304 TaxID=3156614 RepID=UPI0032B4978B
MSFSNQGHTGERVYRLDRFVVPVTACQEFLIRVGQTHEILRRQAGFLQDFLLESPGEDGATIVVTMVEWDSRETVDRVVPIVQAAHREMGFSPKETIARLGITAEIGIYQAIERRGLAAA